MIKEVASRRRNILPATAARRVGMGAVVWFGLVTCALADQPPVHFQYPDSLPPGAIGKAQLERGGPIPGYFQPVEIKAPAGASVSAAVYGEFEPPKPGVFRAGMLIGAVYRLRVSGIPNHDGMETYPTVEVIDRLYPPIGMETKFPIPIELTQEELEMALDGKFVTRVIYLEDPDSALPAVEDPKQQAYFEAGEGDNPMHVADSLGRPMAILRMGGRVPDASGPDGLFLFGSPPFVRWQSAADRMQQQQPVFFGDTSKLKRVEPASTAKPLRQPLPRKELSR